MGLDMYAMTLAVTPLSPVDFDQQQATELHYWRKHPNLHGWMERLYYAKGGRAQPFNLQGVCITGEDLDRLETDIRNGNLPLTEGFFFGESDGSERSDDLAFIAKARQALGESLTVFYTSWW